MNDFVIHIPQYEGPLDLLLSIVRKDDFSITNLPLAPITAQYLTYIDQATSRDVNLSMEWIEMAAKLIFWKSASLLPSDPTLADPTETLAQELGRELKSLNDQQLAKAKDFLAGLSSSSEQRHTNSGDPNAVPAFPDDAPASLWTLRKKAQILQHIFRTRHPSPNAAYVPSKEDASIEMMTAWIFHKLNHIHTPQWIDVHPWLEQVNNISQQIALFLALLELARTNIIRLQQHNDTLSIFPIPTTHPSMD